MITNTPGERLKAARIRAGYVTAKDAAEAMDVPVATYAMHENAVKHLPARRADEYAAYFKVTPEYLLYGRGKEVKRVPIRNNHGELTGQDVAPCPPPSDLTYAVAGDGIAYPGMAALYNHPQGDRPPPAIHGRLCVVAIRGAHGDGFEQIVRIVHTGTQPDRYHLIGPAMLPLIDHEVLWIAPVLALVPL